MNRKRNIMNRRNIVLSAMILLGAAGISAQSAGQSAIDEIFGPDGGLADNAM